MHIFMYYIYIYITNFHACRDMWFETRRHDVHGHGYVCARMGGGAPQWIFQFHVVFSFAHRRFHPSASSFAPARSKPRSASLTLEVCAACLCTAVIYSLFERYGSGFSLTLPGRRKWIRVVASTKFVDFKLSERGEFVDIPPRHPMYREPSWKLLVMQLAVGAGNPGQTDSSHTELISWAFEAGTILKLVARLPPYRFPI